MTWGLQCSEDKLPKTQPNMNLCHPINIGIPNVGIRQWYDNLISTTEIPIYKKGDFYTWAIGFWMLSFTEK